MKPSIGRDVHLLGLAGNGAEFSAAKITRAWSELDTASGPAAVNLIVFVDGGPPVHLSSVMLFDTKAAALAHRGADPRAHAAFWPERV